MTVSRKTGPKPAQMEHFFVYGTLAPGRPNAHVLADIAGTWTPATVRGSLVADGWGAALGYPGIVLSDGPGLVHGLVFSSPQLSAHWQRLDAFEGEGLRARGGAGDTGQWRLRASVDLCPGRPGGLRRDVLTPLDIAAAAHGTPQARPTAGIARRRQRLSARRKGRAAGSIRNGRNQAGTGFPAGHSAAFITNNRPKR